MKKVKLLIPIIILVIVSNCRYISIANCTINLSPIKSKTPVKIVLFKFGFNAQYKWENIKLDSITTNKDIVTWPLKYHSPFIANFIIYNNRDEIIGFTDDFIFSNSNLNIERDEKKKPVNIQGKYENAFSFKIEGGDNELFKNKEFLNPPHLNSAFSFAREKIKNEKYLNPKNEEFANAWRPYENTVFENVKKYHDSYYTLFKLINISSEISNATLEKCYNELDANLKTTYEGEFIKNYLNRSAQVYINNKLIIFNLKNINDREFTFNKTLISKYYLIDFWASWCTSCRQQMQLLKEIHSKIDTNKIQFISLSCDLQRDQWINASKAENLKWPDYIQSDQPNQKLMTLFSMGYIPQNILIDKHGVIINKNMTVNELEKFISDKELRSTENELR